MASKGSTGPVEPEPDRFRTLPARIRPEEMVESRETRGLNRSGAPAGDPDAEFMLRHIGV